MSTLKPLLALLAAATLAACSSGVPTAAGTGPEPAATAALPSVAAGSAAAAAPTAAASAGHTPMTVGSSELPAFHWRLAHATDASGQPIADLLVSTEKPLQLDFQPGMVALSNGCNRSRGSWSVTGDEIRFGQRAATLMACPDGKLEALDAAAARYLAGTLKFQLTATAGYPTLRLATTDGATLEFTGVPTAETRYGSAGETVFLEVAPRTVACSGAAPQAGDTCLSVRAVHYAANGLRAGEPGPWQTLEHPIEGYTHEPDAGAVLRVKRYVDGTAPAGTSSVAYVLDMMVESRRAKP